MDLRWLKEMLERPGYSQAGLAVALKRNPSSINRMLKGERQIKANEVPVILHYLDQAADPLAAGEAAAAATARPSDAFPLAQARPEPVRLGGPSSDRERADLPIFASAAGGPEGAWILSNEPMGWLFRDQRLMGVRDAFACYVVGDSMAPAYERGNLLLVNPLAPPSESDDCLLIKETEEGERYALVKRLVRFNATSWTLKQFNPEKTFSLPRREWQRALLVIGKYNRG